MILQCSMCLCAPVCLRLQFVSMAGFRKFGLVHSSQVSNYIAFTREHSDEEKKAELVSGGAAAGEAETAPAGEWRGGRRGGRDSTCWGVDRGRMGDKRGSREEGTASGLSGE